MNTNVAFGLVLIAGLMIKELSYFTPHMIFTHKSIPDWAFFICGIIILVFLTVRFASGWAQISFGVVGIIAFSAMWIKQGVSSKGALTNGPRQEFYPWKFIDSVKIEEGKEVNVSWMKEDGFLILKQKYSLKDVSLLRERIEEQGIKEI